MALAMSSGALAESVNTPPGCTSWVTKATITKITAARTAVSRIARGIVFLGSTASSAKVLTASKPMKL